MKTINWLERRESKTGKSFAKLELKDEQGVIHSSVSVWSDFPNFENLAPGMQVDGELVKKGEYTNLVVAKTSYSPNYTPRANSGPTRAFAAAQEVKGKQIERSQEHKDNSIKVSSTMRDAVLLVTTFYRDVTMSDKEIEEKVKVWRSKLWEMWEDHKNYPPVL